MLTVTLYPYSPEFSFDTDASRTLKLRKSTLAADDKEVGKIDISDIDPTNISPDDVSLFSETI